MVEVSWDDGHVHLTFSLLDNELQLLQHCLSRWINVNRQFALCYLVCVCLCLVSWLSSNSLLFSWNTPQAVASNGDVDGAHELIQRLLEDKETKSQARHRTDAFERTAKTAMT